MVWAATFIRAGLIDSWKRLVSALLPPTTQRLLGIYCATKGRLLLTQLVLIAAGSAFLMVMSLNSSLALTLDNFFGRQRYDTEIHFQGQSESKPRGIHG